MKLARQSGHSRFQQWTAVFFLLLVAAFSFVQAVHLHDDLAPTGATRTHCSLCLFSHSPAVATAAGAAPIPVRDYASLQLSEPQLRSRLLVASISIRPLPSL